MIRIRSREWKALVLLCALTLAAPLAAGAQGKGQGPGAGGKGDKGQQGGQGGRGQGGPVPGPRGDDDSDRPPWAGGDREENPHAQGGGPPDEAGTKKGDLYGDLWILLRDENGEPILSAEGFVQPIDADGQIIPLDEEGHPVDESLVQEVELGRLSVARSPSKVTGHALDEAISKLTAATTITLDDAGRLVMDGETTIDSPLENLALYEEYMTEGGLAGVALPAGFDPAALLGAAADKTGEITIDVLVYQNSILGVNTVNSDGSITYHDFSSYDYDRASTYTGTITYLKDTDGDGVYETVTESIMDSVFDGTNWTDATAGGADDFAQAADDARAVIEFVHAMPTP